MYTLYGERNRAQRIRIGKSQLQQRTNAFRLYVFRYVVLYSTSTYEKRSQVRFSILLDTLITQLIGQYWPSFSQ